MAKRQIEETPRDASQNGKWPLGITFLFTIGQLSLREFGVPTPLAVFVSGSFFYLAAYWAPPRVEISFWKYALLVESFLIGFVSAFWLIPPYLERNMPVWLAFSLPIFVFSVLFYFLCGLNSRLAARRAGFGKWVLGCLAVTVSITLLKLFLLESK